MRIKMDDARTERLKNMAINSTSQFNGPGLSEENFRSNCPSSSASTLLSPTYLNLHKVPDLPNSSRLPNLLNHEELLDDNNSVLMSPSTFDKYIPQGLIQDDLTDEDRRLAATLVAVQFQQKNHPSNMINLLSHQIPSSGSKLNTLGEPNLMGLPTLIGPNKPPSPSMMPTLIPYNAGSQTHLMTNGLHQLPPLKKGTVRNRYLENQYLTSETPANIPLESLGIQTEIGGMDMDAGDIRSDGNLEFILADDEVKYSFHSEESDTSDSVYDPSRRQSLPHKKRLPRRLRNPKKCPARSPRNAVKRPNGTSPIQTFTCELCLLSLPNQWKFFEHLKSHYDVTGIPYQLEPSPLNISKSNCMDEKVLDGEPSTEVKTEIKDPASSPVPIINLEPQQSTTNRATSSPTLSNSTSTIPIVSELRPAIIQITELPKVSSFRDNLPPAPPLVRGKTVDMSKFIENNIIPCSTPPNSTYENLELLSSSPVVLHQCEICKRAFRRLKAYEAHMANSHVRSDTIEEFSEPEDMMEGIRVNVDSDEEDSQPLIRDSTEEKNWYQTNSMFTSEEHFDEEIKVAEEEQELQNELVRVSDVRPLTVAVPTNAPLNVTVLRSVDGADVRSLNVNPVPSSLAAAAAAFAVNSSTVSKFCGICNKTFKSRLECSQHISEKHNAVVKSMTEMSCKPSKFNDKKKPLICPECGRHFVHRNSFKYHLRSHLGKRPYNCNECGKSFFAKSVLKVHLRRHTGVRPFKCEFCARLFRQWGDLKYHVISIHTNQKEYQCEVCGKDFARKYSLTLHMRIHTGERNYKCDFCEKKFRASSYLLNHRKIHTGEKPHKCDICDRYFRVRSDMNRHKLTHKAQACCKRVLATKVSDDNCADKCNKLQGAFGQQQINLTDICKAEGFEPSTVSGILTIDGVRTGKRLQETTGSIATSDAVTEPKSQTGVYFWQILPTA